MGLCCGNPRLPYRNLASSDLSLERCAIETRLILNNRKPRKSLSLRNNRTPSTWIVAQSSRFRGISMHRRQVEDVEKRATIKKNASPSRRISDGWPVNISTATLLRIILDVISLLLRLSSSRSRRGVVSSALQQSRWNISR